MRTPRTLLSISPSTCLFAAATLLALTLITGTVRAQPFTNTIYQDGFARVGALNGSAPDTVNTPGATWQAPTTLNTDGSQIALTNSPNPAGGVYLSGFLPFTPKVGHIYTLSCQIKAISGAANFLDLGFTTSTLTDSNFLAYRIGAGREGVRGDGGQLRGTRGPGVANQGTLTAAFGGNTNLFSVVLDTTTGNESFGWTVRFYTNGVQSFGPAANGVNANPPIKYVAISSDGATGYFQQFTLTDALIRSNAPTIWEQPPNITAQVGQMATFWVGVTNDYPAASYQWMTNSSGGPTNAVPGATNATYTTPALDSSYNGLNYSVAITNINGSTNSALAALTVVSGPPTVYSVTKTPNLTNLVVNFSKPVDPVTGLNAANYSALTINGTPSGVSVLSASAGSTPSSVILRTSTLNTNTGYYLKVQNVQDLFGNAMSASTNAVLPAGMVLFLRADSGVVYDASGALVVQWIDQTTNGNNAVQYFGIPTYNGFIGPAVRPSTNNINGHLALNFGNTTPACGKFLVAPNSPSLASMISNTTMYALCQFTNFSPANEVVNKTWGNLPAPFDWTQGTTISVQYGNGGNNAPASGISGSLSNVPVVMTTVQTFPTAGGTTNDAFYLNGAPNGTAVLRSVVQGMQDGGTPLYIGARSDVVTANMKGQIAEIMLFNTALSDADRTNIDNYLGVKYYTFAITTDLPASTTSSNGFAVTYNFAASAGSAHGFSYQWQEFGTNIPGATGFNYTTPILSTNDNGNMYAVQITLPDNSHVYSTTNTLTVLNMAPYITWAGIPIWNTNEVIVLFDEAAVDPVTATTASNYALNNGASVLSAAIGDAPNKVVLTTTALTLTPGLYTLSASNVMDLYGNTMAAATASVALYPVNIVVWLRADTGVTTDAGTNTVSLWNDLSGNNNNFGQGLATQKGQLVTNAWGDPVVRFNTTDSVTNFMAAASSSSLAILGDMSVVAAMNPRRLSDGRSGHVIAKTGVLPSLGNIPAPYDYTVATAANLLRGNGTGSGAGVSLGAFGATNGPSVGYPFVVAVSETGNTVSHYLNGQVAGIGILGSGFSAANDFDRGQAAYIGARSDGFNRLAGDLAELIVTASPITAGDAVALATYMGAQHHFALFNGNPTNMVVTSSNNQLKLSWPADHIGWQVQSNSLGLTVPGAWFTVPGSTSTNQMTITPSATNPNVFYRMFFQQP